jgi:glutamate-1-semialdehyde 2,1-aminomutase
MLPIHASKETSDDAIADGGLPASPARRQLLGAIPTLMLGSSIGALLVAGTVPARAAPAGAAIPGYWSPTDPARAPLEGPIGQALWARADKVMPSYAMFLSRSARYAGFNVWPGFIKDAHGARCTDVDGSHYIDLTSSNGPNLLGYRHPEVEAIAREQFAKGDLMPVFNAPMIELCERLLRWTDGFHWAVPLKRGSDATELAVRVARARTGKPHLIMFEHTYHGTAAEQSLLYEGVPANGLEHISRLRWNDAAALDDFKASNGESVGAVMLIPVDQPGGAAHTTQPSKEFIAALHRFRERTGAALILDDVRNGFRTHPKGSHKAIGLDPDLICLGKALGNGHAIAALIGKESYRGGAERILYTSTYLFSAVCCAAGVATLDLYERDNAFAAIEHAGQRLMDGFVKLGAKHGHKVSASGPAGTPTLLFDNDPDFVRGERFCHDLATRGVLLHPRMWSMLSSAHDDAVIDETLDAFDKSFATINKEA